MYHVSQVDTAFDDFFTFVARQSKNKKSTDWQVFHWADSQTSRYGTVKNVSLSIRLPNLQMKVSTTFVVFYCQEEIEFSKITVVCSPLYCSGCKLKTIFFFTADFLSLQIFVIGKLFPFPVSVGKSFLWCSVLRTDRLKMFTTWYKKTGWSSFFPVHTFRRWMSWGGGGRGGRVVSQVSVPFVFVDCLQILMLIWSLLFPFKEPLINELTVFFFPLISW